MKDFFRDLFTLRTVWIDKGQGQWTVRKRMHPLLRGVFCVLALIVVVTAYAELRSKPISESEPAIAKTIEPVQKQEQTVQVTLPLEQVSQAPQVSSRREIILPSEMNPDTDRIIPITRPDESIVQFNMPDDGKYRIAVSKLDYKLWLLNGNEIIREYPIATGRNPGDKQRIGDNRTPVGNFRIVSIENASKWTHDFRDGKGKIKGAYGPWFLRLDAKGWKGIGIHGTHDPDSRGTNATEGCIRLSNEDIDELKQYAYRNMPVIIKEKW